MDKAKINKRKNKIGQAQSLTTILVSQLALNIKTTAMEKTKAVIRKNNNASRLRKIANAARKAVSNIERERIILAKF